MLLIDSLLERDEHHALIEVNIPMDSCFQDSRFGILPELYVEIMAQATAAVSGWDALLEAKPPIKGFLVGLNNVEYLGRLSAGETAYVELIKDLEFAEITIMKGVLRNQVGIIMRAELKVWEEKDA